MKTTVMRSSPDLKAFVPEHIVNMVIAAILFVLFTIGIPLFFFAVLFLSRKRHDDPRIFMMFGFLYRGYKKEFWWFESVVTARKIAILFIGFVLPRYPLMQSILMSQVIVVAIAVHCFFWPYGSGAGILNWVELACLVVICMYQQAGIMNSSALVDGDTDLASANTIAQVFGIITVVSNVLLVGLFVGVIVHTGIVKFLARSPPPWRRRRLAVATPSEAEQSDDAPLWVHPKFKIATASAPLELEEGKPDVRPEDIVVWIDSMTHEVLAGTAVRVMIEGDVEVWVDMPRSDRVVTAASAHKKSDRSSSRSPHQLAGTWTDDSGDSGVGAIVAGEEDRCSASCRSYCAPPPSDDDAAEPSASATRRRARVLEAPPIALVALSSAQERSEVFWLWRDAAGASVSHDTPERLCAFGEVDDPQSCFWLDTRTRKLYSTGTSKAACELPSCGQRETRSRSGGAAGRSARTQEQRANQRLFIDKGRQSSMGASGAAASNSNPWGDAAFGGIKSRGGGAASLQIPGGTVEMTVRQANPMGLAGGVEGGGAAPRLPRGQGQGPGTAAEVPPPPPPPPPVAPMFDPFVVDEMEDEAEVLDVEVGDDLSWTAGPELPRTASLARVVVRADAVVSPAAVVPFVEEGEEEEAGEEYFDAESRLYLFNDYEGTVHGKFDEHTLREWYHTGDLHPETPIAVALAGTGEDELVVEGEWSTLEALMGGGRRRKNIRATSHC